MTSDNPTITPAIKIGMTDAAQDFVDRNGDHEGFKVLVESEIESLGAGTDDGPDSIYDIFFHVFSWKGDQNMILAPNVQGDCLIIDLCVMEEGSLIDKGPLKGKRMMFPKPYSQRKVQ